MNAPTPPSACVEAPFVVQCLLATASSLFAGGRGLGNHQGKTEEGGRSECDQSEGSPRSAGPPPLTVARRGRLYGSPGVGDAGVRRREGSNQPTRSPPPPAPTHPEPGLRLGAQAPGWLLIGCRRLGPIPVTPKCWREGAGVAQCKVHLGSPLSGHPAANNSDPVRLGTALPPVLPSPPVAGRLRPGARQPPGLSPWTGTAPPTRAGTSSLHPFPEAARRPRPPPPADPIVFLDALGTGAVSTGEDREHGVRPCPGCFFNGEVGECGGGGKEEEELQLRRQVGAGPGTLARRKRSAHPPAKPQAEPRTSILGGGTEGHFAL